ncbi:YLP motif-containing protein 1-like [Lolium rigidum]|uniref:YLP motif-containing protein 1-like n=1 Tax=Lolium rigidum TaxID=89674 RepID=UPI001F5CF787|nr:YLP motif-containing protein 1-like [Lolium rigidum]
MATTLGKVMEEEAAAIQPKQGSGKVFSVSRLLTRDSSAGAAPSFRVYYGVASAGAVPFLWESQPGTPKNDAASDATMPPLTPPPSYYAAAKEDPRSRKAGGGGGKKVGILGYILPRFAMARRRTRPSGSPTSSFSSVSSSSSSSASTTFSSFRGAQSPACSSMRSGGSSRMRAPSSCSSMRGGRGYGSSRMHSSSASSFSDEDDTAAAALACFGVRGESFRALKACRVAMTVRSALGSVGGGHGTAPVQAQSVKAN